ncbi:efflux RND transporter periplasmic adaptor subunit [Hoeflea prorocentri]|uniref:Efflux RND transporter periplasmic adaptor subunit n=1 Tax=Hoeflea prorocentri TaxID=1922333 RepID=A0A9X3UHD5_9HYPH|nr:efflux RND transporter periplasmic adaptor subunit [Hoeflea prorocentri]MCY6381423.1 efflux RND transporter periplasmic adaptor subunit [Hoeflea prorocentri]MDA5399223.1 efflux RND transporter periplasmic adaptor subunit [Hoeflea prorocentri]
MAFRIKGSHIAALVIAGAVIGWMGTGNIVVGGQANSENAVLPPAEREENRDELFKVRFVTVNPETRPNILLVRGRTKADAIVPVRAETSGTLEKRLVSKGDRVEQGDLVCQLDRGVRQAAVDRALAAYEQAVFDYEGSASLQKQGFASETRMKALKAAMDGAAATLAETRLELDRTDITATADGVVQDPIAEIGDNLSGGDVCVTLINADPLLFIGQVSERQVGQVDVGNRAQVQLISGELVSGTIRYVASSADEATRTFLIEVEIDNPDNALRDGVTAAAQIELDGSEAYQIRPSWLTLNDEGSVGVRVVDEDNSVSFRQLKIISHTPDTMWVTGLEPGTRVISVGQDYVVPGQTVEPVAADIAATMSKDDVRS